MTENTTTESETSQEELSYFLENFTGQGLRYVKAELHAVMCARRDEIYRITDQIANLNSSLRSLQDGLENQKAEMKIINAALEYLKEQALASR